METMTPHSLPPAAPPSERRRRKASTRLRKGQSLVEFALMLPFLLLLIFMIIEFGRMFQTWVTLQNSARAAARYASTGQVNYDLYNVTVPTGAAKDITVLDAIVPCDFNTATGATANDLGAKVLVNGVETYNGPDGLFATWYDGTDCDPTQEDHVQYRKDILRLISVMYEAREAVNALGAESLPNSEDHYYEKLDPQSVRNLLYSYWMNPMPREDQRAWFNVTICSSRGLLDAASRTTPTLHPSVRESRFITVRSEADLTGIPVDSLPEEYPLPYCMLNEIPAPQITGSTGPYTALNHAGTRWLDAGSPGDRVTIAVTFNHPLLTPIRPDEVNYLTMRARRSIVNESFRAPKSTRILANPKVTGSQGGSSSDFTPEVTEPPETPEVTPPIEPTIEVTPPTPDVFSCDKLSVQFGPFNLFIMQLFINNYNAESVELQSVTLSWKDLAAPWNNMYMGVMDLDNDVHWQGGPSSNTKAGGRTSVATGQLTQGYRTVAAQGSGVWSGTFYNGPTQLEEFISLYDFAGSFVFRSASGVVCTVPLTTPPAGEPTDPPPPPTDGPTPTNTPNCVSANQKVKLQFGGFASYGGVWFNVTNNSGRDLTLIGFDVVWPDSKHRDITSETTDYGLARVIVGGADVLDPEGQIVWQANPPVKPGNTNLADPYNNRTVSSQKGTWVTNATIPPTGTAIRIWLDFDSFGGSLKNFGAQPWHFDRSRFKISCRGGGGGGGGGGGEDGDIGVELPTPKATDTLAPSKTPGPTHTTGPATMTRTATQTRTVGPTSSPTQTRQATFTPSRTPFVLATQPPSGGGE